MRPTFHSQPSLGQIIQPPTTLLQPRVLILPQQQQQPLTSGRLMFFVLGHGDSEKKDFKNETNVILIKEVRCGLRSDAKEAYRRANEFYDLSRVSANLDFLNEENEIKPDSALSDFSFDKTISYPNNSFVEGMYTPLTDLKNKEKGEYVTRVFTSGIYSNRTSFIQKGVRLTQIDEKAHITLDNLKVIFNGSLYPTPMKVETFFHWLNKKNGVPEKAPIRFSLFKQHFSEQFSKTISELLIFCSNKARGQISVLYYPLCREISEEFTKDPNLALVANKNLLKMSDEMDDVKKVVRNLVDSVDMGAKGITKKRKNHKKTQKTWKKKTQKKKRNKQYNNKI